MKRKAPLIAPGVLPTWMVLTFAVLNLLFWGGGVAALCWVVWWVLS